LTANHLRWPELARVARLRLQDPDAAIGGVARALHGFNASIATLTDVVRNYEKDGMDRPSRSPLMVPIQLTDRERLDLVAFMESLTGDAEGPHTAANEPSIGLRITAHTTGLRDRTVEEHRDRYFLLPIAFTSTLAVYIERLHASN
jgi:hypothetical protein